MPQSRSVGDVRAFLAGWQIDVVELPADASTAELAAAALNVAVAAIVKSLLFLAAERPILLLVSGDRRVDTNLVARVLSVEGIRLARPAEVLAMTGYPVGGVPPVAHMTPPRVLMDRRLFDHATVYAAAGAHNAVFPVAPAQLVEIAGAEVADITPAGG